jgi:SAM-dependent methyltransferase
MFRCSACRTAFVHPTPSDEELTRFYNTYHLGDDQGGTYDAVEARMQADFPAKVALVKSATGGNPGRVLDVGCGKGYFVKACRDAGIDAQGCDLSESGVAFAREKLGVPATAGLLRDLIPTLGQFDTATFWATIEHLPDPVGTLRDIHAVLKPGGRLLMDTGIGADWLDNLLPGCAQWYNPPEHLFVFSGAGLRKAVELSGFTVESHAQNFERSGLRRLMKNTRNALLATGLRLAAGAGRMKSSGFTMTRYPVGNLQSIVARKA